MGEELQCQRCEYEWEYNGSRHYASCPNCKTSVSVGRFGSSSNEGVSSTDGISEQEFAELQSKVEANTGQIDAVADHVASLEVQLGEVEERLGDLAARDAVETEQIEEQIEELYEAFRLVAEEMGGSVSFDHEPDGSGSSGVYDPTEEFDG